MLMFHRKVKYPLEEVEVSIEGYLLGERVDIGQLRFPSKQSWTKFWGAVQRGALQVPELDVNMVNVADDPPPAASVVDPSKPVITAPTGGKPE